jgi:hypothetical protein
MLALGDGEGVEGLDLPFLGVVEDLGHFGYGNAVIDGYLHVVLFDFEHAAQTAVGDEQPCRSSWRRGGDRNERESGQQAAQTVSESMDCRFHINCFLFFVHGRLVTALWAFTNQQPMVKTTHISCAVRGRFGVSC